MRDWHHQEEMSVVAYCEGELTGQELSEFEEHLQSCERCQEEVSSIRRLDQLTASIPLLELPVGLMASLTPSPEIPRRRSWLLPVLGLAATLALAALIFRPGRPPEMACHSPGLELPPKLHSVTPGETRSASILTTSTVPKLWHSDGQAVKFQLVGQTVLLSPNSEVERIALDDQRATLRLNFGTVRIQETGQHISVRTSHLQVRPIGTDYQVSTNLKTSQVKVNQGVVEVTSDKHKSVQLIAGSSLSWPEVGSAAQTPSEEAKTPHSPAEPGSPAPRLPDSEYPTGRQPSHQQTSDPKPIGLPAEPEHPSPPPDEPRPVHSPTPGQRPQDGPGQERPLPPDGPPGYNHPPHPPGGRPGGPGHLPPHLRPRFPGGRSPHPSGPPGL